MPKLPKLTEDELATTLADLPDWRHQGAALTRTLRFGDFPEAIAFTTRTALLAERMDHHPDLDIRYRDVTVRLTTHDAGGITALDIGMAREIDEWTR